ADLQRQQQRIEFAAQLGLRKAGGRKNREGSAEASHSIRETAVASLSLDLDDASRGPKRCSSRPCLKPVEIPQPSTERFNPLLSCHVTVTSAKNFGGARDEQQSSSLCNPRGMEVSRAARSQAYHLWTSILICENLSSKKGCEGDLRRQANSQCDALFPVI